MLGTGLGSRKALVVVMVFLSCEGVGPSFRSWARGRSLGYSFRPKTRPWARLRGRGYSFKPKTIA